MKATRVLALVSLVFAFPVAAAVPLKDAVHEYGPDSALTPLDKTFQMALLEKGWIPLTAAEREITAQINLRAHNAKVRIRFGDGKATFTLMDAKNLDTGPCTIWVADKETRFDACVHPAYYEWLEGVIAALPLARARVLLVQSVANPGASKP